MRINNVNLTPTMRCNLKCKLCGVLVPQYDYRPQMDEQEFNETLNALFNVVDHVKRLQITGGEPLMHPNLHIILDDCFKYSYKFDELWLFSNCSIPFRDNVLSVLKKHKEKVMVHCSDYGKNMDVSQTNNKLLVEAEVPFKYLKYYGENQYFDGWVDNGDFIAHHRSVEENEAIFSSCTHVNRGGSWYIRHGQMHWCGRSIRGTELNKIPLDKKDYLDLFDTTTSADEKKKLLEELMKVRTITACDYCNGYYGTNDISKRYPAGEQI